MENVSECLFYQELMDDMEAKTVWNTVSKFLIMKIVMRSKKLNECFIVIV